MVRHQVGRRHFAAQQHLVADDDGARRRRGIAWRARSSWRSAPGSCPGRWTATALAALSAGSCRALVGTLLYTVFDRIGANAIGVFRQQRQICVDLVGLDLGSLDQRILAVRGTARRRHSRAFRPAPSGEGGSMTGEPSHHHTTPIASAVTTNNASAGPIAWFIYGSRHRLALTLTVRSCQAAANRVRAAMRCMLDKSTELGCGPVSHAGNGPPQWRHNLVAQETSQLTGHRGPTKSNQCPIEC